MADLDPNYAISFGDIAVGDMSSPRAGAPESDEARGSGRPENGLPAVPRLANGTDYLNLFWSGADTLRLNQSFSEPSVSVAGSAAVEPVGQSRQRRPDKLAKARAPVTRVPPRKAPPPIRNKILPSLHDRQEKRPLVLTEEVMRQKVELLSRRPAQKVDDAATAPPALCTDGPHLSFSCVDALQQESVPGSFEYLQIPATVSAVRLDLTALTGDGAEWEVSSRQAFPEVFSGRKETFFQIDPKDSAERIEIARSSLLSKSDYKKTPRHVLEYNGFMHRYCVGFMCLVFDLRMQLVGTYDLNYGVFLPGMTVCPPNIEVHNAEQFKKTASLIRVDFTTLPRNVFAVVPVVFDQAGHSLPDIGLSCYLSATTGEEGKWHALSDRMRKFIAVRKSVDSDGKILQAASKDAAFTAEFDKNCGYSPFALFRRSSYDKGWGMKSLNLPIRGTRTSELVAAVVDGLCRARVMTYHVMHIEHCCDCDRHAMTTWHIPGSYEKRCIDVRKAIREGVPPAFVYSNTLRRPLGDEKNTDNGMARIGAFEVVVRPYFSEYSMRIYSKLCQKVLPQPSDVMDICSSLLLPDRLQYSRKRVVHIALFDSYYKTLAKDARVILFKVNTHYVTASEDFESTASLREVETCMPSELKGGASGVLTECCQELNAAPRSVVVSGRSRPTSAGLSKRFARMSPSLGHENEKSKTTGRGNKRMPSKKFSSEEKKNTFSEELMKSEAVQDCIFRHSLAYYRVRCWSQQEVDQWMRFHGVSDAAIANAHASGVEDGASLLALANKITLRNWGIRGQLVLKSLDASLAEMRESVHDYDPCVLEGLPEDGQERKGFSRASPDYIPGGSTKSSGRNTYEQFAVSNMSSDGTAQFDIGVAGTYVFVATSPGTITYCSHSFTCGASMEYCYSALLKPKIVPIYFRTIMEDSKSKLLDGVPFATGGLLFSVVNLACGKRHTGYVNFDDAYDEPITEVAMGLAEPIEAKSKFSPPKLQRFNSIVDVLSVSPTHADLSRPQTTGGSGSTSGPSVRPFARAKKKSDIKKTHNRVIISVVWLPVGKYYSEVDGSVFSVYDEAHTQYIRETPPLKLVLAPHERNTDGTSGDDLAFGGEVGQRAVIKCHKRLIKSSIRGFQMIYRRYKKTFLFDKMCAYMVMRRGAKNFCDWAREEVKKKKVVKLQAWMRMAREFKNYRAFWASTVFIQTRLRILLARIRLRRLQRAQRTLYNAVILWYRSFMIRRFNAALIIQMAYRRTAAIKKKDCLIFAKRCKKLFVRYIGRIKAKIRLANAAKLARRREQDERDEMVREEDHMRQHHLWLKMEDRRLLDIRLKAIWKKKFIAASCIQAFVRGRLFRRRLRRGKQAVIHLQRVHRVKIYFRRIMAGEKMKYIPGLQQLLSHPLLLGGVLLLLGVWNPDVTHKNSETSCITKGTGTRMPRTKDEQGRHRPAMKLNTETAEEMKGPREVPPEKQLSEISAYAKYLERYAIKIQSFFRMARTRMAFVASETTKRANPPPLFRRIEIPIRIDSTAAGSENVFETNRDSAAVKIQSIARRFVVRLCHSKPSELKSESVVCSEALNLTEEVLQNRGELIEEALSDFYPGYYDDNGVYIYYQSDSAGGDYFGYYDDDGNYLYCDGDRSKVMFDASPTVSNELLQEAQSAHHGAHENTQRTQELSAIDSTTDSTVSQVVLTDVGLEVNSRKCTESLRREKSVAFQTIPEEGTPDTSKKAPETVDDLDVGHFVEHEDNIFDNTPREMLNENPKSGQSGQKSLFRPWSFLSELSEDNTHIHKPENSRFPRVRSFASGLTGATDMSGTRSLSESLKDAFSATSKAISLKSSSLKHKAGLISGELSSNITAATQQMKTTADKNRAEKERLLRIKNHNFQIEDAVLTVRGSAMADIPRLNRQWFIGVFPHTTDALSVEGEDRTEHVRAREKDQQEYEMRHGRHIGEANRSALLYPLSKESFQRLNFSLQLAELPRYVVIDICLFVEADEGALVRPDYLPSNVSVPSAENKLLSKDMSTKRWLPAFRGELRIDEGAAFGPCGGKMNVLLRPNLSEAIYLSRAQARRLSLLEGLTVSVALQPVAVPSLDFLRSLQDDTPPPILPGHIIDAVLLQKYKSTQTFSGAAVCAGCFGDKILVSARHKGAPLGLLEFNKNGECIGRITSHLETLKTIVNIVVGARHVILCSNGGLMAMIRPRKTTDTWSSPSYIELHKSTVIIGTAMHRAGIDFFFTVDKYSNIGVSMYENGRLLKCYLNGVFANSTICSITACCNSLYLGQTDGVLLVLDVTDLIDGEFRIGGILSEKIIYCGEVFGNKTSISSLAILATNAFFSLPTEDPPPGRRVKASIKKVSKLKNDGFSGKSILNSALYGENDSAADDDASLEGHLILIGGGDGDPRVKIMRVVRVVPKAIDAVELGRVDGKAEAYTTLQEIAILRGHTRAISALIVDAAGRFIISASKEENMFLVWNSFTFTCEKLFDDVEIGSIYGGVNSLFVCSFKPPYLTMYTVPETRREGWESNAAVTTDGRPEIGMVRTNLWCTASVKGGVSIPSKSIVRATQYLGDNGRSVVEMWQRFHNRSLNEEYTGGFGNATPSGQSIFSKDIRNVKSMTMNESRTAMNKKPIVSARNYVPLPDDSAVNGTDPVWGTAVKHHDGSSRDSDDQWGENARQPIDSENSDEHSISSAISTGDYPTAHEESDHEDVEHTDIFSDSPVRSVSTVVGRDPFAGKIAHKMKALASQTVEISFGIRPNRSKRYNTDGNEVSLAPGRKAHFSDSDSDDDENNIAILPRRRNIIAGTDSEEQYLNDVVPVTSFPRRKQKKGVVTELKDVIDSSSESDT